MLFAGVLRVCVEHQVETAENEHYSACMDCDVRSTHTHHVAADNRARAQTHTTRERMF